MEPGTLKIPGPERGNIFCKNMPGRNVELKAYFFFILAVEPFDSSNLLLGQWLLLNK